MVLLTLILAVSVMPVKEFGEPVFVVYDSAAPEMSIGLIGDTFLEMNDLMDHFTVQYFEPDAIILRDTRDGAAVKVPVEGEVSEEAQRYALHRFMVKQMRAIYDAQIAFEARFESGYARDLETLIVQGLLKDGFEDGVKMGYRFSVARTGQTPRHALDYLNKPTFLAVAVPVDEYEAGSPVYFSVDHLGEVRSAESLYHVPWAPVWDYNDSGIGEISEAVEIEDDFVY